MTRSERDREKIAKALYENVPERMHDTWEEVPSTAKAIWRDIAARHLANGGEIPAERQPMELRQ